MKNTYLKIFLAFAILTLITACKSEEEAQIVEPSQVESRPDVPATDPVSDSDDNATPDETLTLVSPANFNVTSSSTTVNLQGFSDTDYDSAEFYFDSQCVTAIEQSNQNQVSNGGVQITVSDNTTTDIYAALFRNGVSSGCEHILSYTNDLTAPNISTLSQVDISNVQQTQSVAVSGQADSDVVRVDLFSDSSCQSQVGTGSLVEFNQGVQFYYVNWNQETIIYAQTVDSADNVSTCHELGRFDLSI